ncbi:SIMPL domain-containing protein [Massilia endophytica]|uniref:SIMPL domain-containing protein n=1 Tax=Massilia endophytica TaxID=2899220 RepID=UPI001E5FEA0D|nr:SIMPL domain-containing protein [Massilia endophytica]UGQ49115.1 SIMPL domain-containing protein [Massilia endophytica]
MRMLYLIAVSVCIFAASACTAAEFPDYNFIHVTGDAYVLVPPDRGQIFFDIRIRDSDPAMATARLETRLNEIQQLVSSTGATFIDLGELKRDIAEAQDKTELVTLRRNLRIDVDDLAVWKQMLAPLLVMPDLDKLSLFFDTSRREDVENELSAEAGRNARRRAELLAKSFGRTVTVASAITEGQLRNLSASMGLVTSNGAVNRAKKLTQAYDPTSIVTLRFAKSIDVIFRTK